MPNPTIAGWDSHKAVRLIGAMLLLILDRITYLLRFRISLHLRKLKVESNH